MGGPEKGRFGGYITTETLFLGAGTSTGAATTCRTLLQDFKKLWWISISYLMEKETLITFENWKRCVADNPSVIEFLYNHRRDRTFPGL